MKASKKYRVAYSFSGGGNIIVESTSMAAAVDQAREVLKQIVPQLRPDSARVYKSQVEIIPNESQETHSRLSFNTINGSMEELLD